MTDSMLCILDTETTGLNPQIHQPYEVAFAFDDSDVLSFDLPHTLENADETALNIGRYFERGFKPWGHEVDRAREAGRLAKLLRGVTLVGSNPAFDAAMLRKFIGTATWNHRLINVAEGAMWVFGWDRPKGLAQVSEALRAEGFEIPEPDHTASQDVLATRAVYYALRELRSR